MGRICSAGIFIQQHSVPVALVLMKIRNMSLCPSKSATGIWNKAMADLAKWLCDQGSDPLLSMDLVSLLNAWCNSDETADLQP